METTLSLIALACVCLVVGIYFFFVRQRSNEQQPQDSQ